MSGGETLRQLAVLFLKLGTVAFGGPAAHIAMMEDEVVRRRAWLTREQFLDYLGAANVIPGPNSTELAIFIGHARAGWPGLIVAGVCFILPATLIVAVLAWGYVEYGALPSIGRLLYGVKPVVIAIVAQALWGLTRATVRSAFMAAIVAAAAAAALLGVHELLVLGVCGALVGAAGAWPALRARSRDAARLLALATAPAAIAHAATLSGFTGTFLAVQDSASSVVPLSRIFLVFAKIGSVLFGSGYVLLAFLRADLVERLGWIGERQLLDATVVGQITPGPLFTTATFIGYLVAGPSGAAAATLGIFLPAFVFVAIGGPLVPRIRRSATAGRVLDGVVAASLALMAVVSWQLARTAVIDTLTLVLALVSLFALVRYRVSSGWLVLGGALAGLASSG